MAYSHSIRRFRGSRKRLQRIRLSSRQRWTMLLIALLCLLSVAVGAWLGANFRD